MAKHPRVAEEMKHGQADDYGEHCEECGFHLRPQKHKARNADDQQPEPQTADSEKQKRIFLHFYSSNKHMILGSLRSAMPSSDKLLSSAFQSSTAFVISGIISLRVTSTMNATVASTAAGGALPESIPPNSSRASSLSSESSGSAFSSITNSG